MEITVDLNQLSVNSRRLLAREITDPTVLILLAIDEDVSVRIAVAKNKSINKDIFAILVKDECYDVILALLIHHKLPETNTSFLAQRFLHISSSQNRVVENIKSRLIEQESITADAISSILKEDKCSSLLYMATFNEQISSDTLKLILKSTNSSLTAARALEHRNTKFEDIEEYMFSHIFQRDCDFYTVNLYLSHPQTSSKSIDAFTKYLVKQYLDIGNPKTAYEHLLLEIVENHKTSLETLDWLVSESRKISLLTDNMMLKRFKQSLKSNPNVTKDFLLKV